MINLRFHWKIIFIQGVILAILFGCASRPQPLPVQYKNTLAFGAVDLNISNRNKNSIYYSLGTALKIFDKQTHKHKNFSILALSGGGSRGAFGAGFLDAWSHTNTMPNFELITGVSTGAIMAPFVFLHDQNEIENIKYFYTQTNTDEIFENDYLSALSSGHIANAKPLKKLLDKTMNAAFIEKIAKRHRQGYRLYIGTTNLDTGKFTVWDMGAIANSNKVDKVERFKQIILASSALPAFVPPQYIAVDIDGKKYYQMHVDGGVYHQIFIVGLMQDWHTLLHLTHAKEKQHVTLYLIANRKYRQRDYYEPVEQNLIDIAKAYVLTEMDLLFDRSSYRIYQSAVQNGYNFKMISIPDGMKPIIENPTKFEPKSLQKLFQLGYKIGEKPHFKEEIRFDEYDRL